MKTSEHASLKEKTGEKEKERRKEKKGEILSRARPARFCNVPSNSKEIFAEINGQLSLLRGRGFLNLVPDLNEVSVRQR
jgi:hypothetical protein